VPTLGTEFADLIVGDMIVFLHATEWPNEANSLHLTRPMAAGPMMTVWILLLLFAFFALFFGLVFFSEHIIRPR